MLQIQVQSEMGPETEPLEKVDNINDAGPQIPKRHFILRVCIIKETRNSQGTSARDTNQFIQNQKKESRKLEAYKYKI